MKPKVYIAAAGPPRAQVQSIVSKTKSAAMVPINGKPIIGWILDNLIKQGLNDFVLLIPKNDKQIQNYLGQRYQRERKIDFVEVEDPWHPKGVANSILEGLNKEDADADIFIVLGHTICESEFSFDNDWVMYDYVNSEQSRWCYIETNDDNEVIKFVDKPKERVLPDKALIGFYYISDASLLKSCLIEAQGNADMYSPFQLSQALIIYNKKKKIKAVQAPKNMWLDCGNVIGLNKSKRRLLEVRSFNSITIDEDLGILQKQNENSADLNKEYMWYVGLPNELLALFPRVIKFSHGKSGNPCELYLEYYGYPTLAEAWVYDNLHIDIWFSVIDHILSIARKFRTYSSDLPIDSYKSMYWDKTVNRLKKLSKQNRVWNSLLTYNSLIVNGVELQGFPQLRQSIKKRISNLYNDGKDTTIIHGDFHFGNILYDVNSRLIKLIDPRGNFGGSGIYGDSKYDLAKLRHSISGGYNFVVHDLFQTSQEENKLTLKLPYNEDHQKIVKWFDQQLKEEGFSVDSIKLIEGLLFISMLPLHKGNLNRQIGLFARGIMILNEVFNPQIYTEDYLKKLYGL
ncbi:MAG: hypothetical protein H6575_06720 [Lewinellaceae bacterium]|nr:hypothetical protein [Lewinellaceae bacterium]